MMVDLKPCPFCGCAPVVDGDKIVCPERHCWGPIVEHYDSIDDAAEAWNRRALSPAGTASEMEPVAWEGYWDGAGSISSETRYTRSIAAMERWAADGAKITPLYALPPKTEGWQPIETAPKDGTRIYVAEVTDEYDNVMEARWCTLYGPNDLNPPEIGRLMTGWWGLSWRVGDSRWPGAKDRDLSPYGRADITAISPTHWRPLPAPPKAGE